MTEERKLAALSACEKFLRESKWNVHTGLLADFWIAAVEWADDNPDLSNVCSTTGLGDIPIGRFRRGKKTNTSVGRRNAVQVRTFSQPKRFILRHTGL